MGSHACEILKVEKMAVFFSPDDNEVDRRETRLLNSQHDALFIDLRGCLIIFMEKRMRASTIELPPISLAFSY